MVKKLGLALGGGGARGLVHIGVLKILEKEGIPINYISGTSMGGIIATAYALGYSPVQMENEANRFSHLRHLARLVDLASPRRGMLEGAKVRAYLENLFHEGSTFKDTKIPLALTAVDLINGKEIYIDNGPLLIAVFATIAVPGIFPSINIDGMMLVDGGVLNNVPANLTRKLGADVVVAINPQQNPEIEPPWQKLEKPPQWIKIAPEPFLDLYRAFMIMAARITHDQLRQCPPDLEICPRLDPDVTIFMGFPKSRHIIAAGEEAAYRALPKIKQLLK
jgi:NTE family protein